ncbi:hypothetical protein MSAN_02117500 [Mycena sanguinolenta]|uniref:F-box domain-containing protein n=1 Tax=Mycena sanguinolenta TaxID=230812 RepID=A0A8H6XIC2_9AGAR|nr:hypothetical protein MSAN_02117500 [Mycena sanguinolenta]
MDISCWLPNEVLVHIIQHSGKADQATLCRLSKLFQDLCLPVLYRAVKIKGPHSIASFCSGIIENPPRADAVRSVNLQVHHSNYSDIHRDLILATLKLMSKLEYLSLSRFLLDDYHNRILLEECNFPQLISCYLWLPSNRGRHFPIPLSDWTTSFLIRHPTLKQVHLHSDSRMVVSQSPRVSLPNLEFYAGHAAFILGIDAIRLKETQLTWFDADHADVDKIIARLSSMTNADLPFISSHRYSGDDYSQIMISVSTHMPHTRTLRVHRSFRTYVSEVNHDSIRVITECLPKFTKLVYLAMDWESYLNKAENWSAVERLIEVCPTLEACCSNHDVWRKVNGRWEECELEEFEVLAKPPDPTDR